MKYTNVQNNFLAHPFNVVQTLIFIYFLFGETHIWTGFYPDEILVAGFFPGTYSSIQNGSPKQRPLLINHQPEG